MGSTGSGKSAWVKQALINKGMKRVAIWDYKREYGTDFADLITENLGQAVRAMSKGAFRVAFRPSFNDKTRAQQFNVWCKAVWHAKNCFCLVEELAMVTTPQRAPEGWKQLTCTGRSEGITIVGLSQRPAQVDKDFFDNCTELHCGFLAGKNSRRTMAEEMDIEERAITALGPLEYVHKKLRTKEISYGKVKKTW